MEAEITLSAHSYIIFCGKKYIIIHVGEKTSKGYLTKSERVQLEIELKDYLSLGFHLPSQARASKSLMIKLNNLMKGGYLILL